MIGTTVVEHVFANLQALMPFRILKSFQQGVRWTWGKNPKPLGPGPHLCLPVLHSMSVHDVVDEVLNLPTQSVVTKDGHPICFSVNIAFRIADIVAHECNVQDFIESTAGAAMTHLSKQMRKKTLDELMAPDALTKMEDSLKGTLTTKMRRWGTEIIDVGFTDFVPRPRALRLFLDANMGNKSA